MRRRITAHWVFFKSTLSFSIPVMGVLAWLGLGVSAKMPVGVLGWISAVLAYFPVAIILDFLYKELSRKEEYYFYHNLSITRLELWIVSFLLSYSVYLLSFFAHSLWNMASK
ncbi:hypothetical protein M2137_002694 [Parabacteroides sp. PFB2-10]|uniref:hypothetical protein n=1 Tax=Parabacteroides sp. PFB2-10 TaxID=1742405 RepID=UPI0024769C68|nr:hypothetical protein [Parabacteroides sp. PFB2-10]MDH6313903.1 hypothetical protein [Parabacteroides sp. PFB2-10]